MYLYLENKGHLAIVINLFFSSACLSDGGEMVTGKRQHYSQ